MQIVLTTLNAKFTHLSLALRYLKEYCQQDFPEIITLEYNINQPLPLIMAEIVAQKPDIIGFSCYIWNIEQTLEIAGNIKKVLPQTTIILGGPEVSYDFEPLLKEHPFIDFVVSGEGEEAFLKLLHVLTTDGNKEQLRKVPGLVYRDRGTIKLSPNPTVDLAKIPNVYHPNDDLEHKIVYYESSRGCPFRCEYCLSSRTGAVRYFPLERVKRELRILADKNIEQVRFIDRTFNCHPKRATELLAFMAELETRTRFQLEIAGDLLTDEMIEILKKAPPGRFQFEIGVQSTNPATLEAISRKTDLEKLACNLRKLREETNVRVLLDLIAGLPYEDYNSFGRSFDYVYDLQPTTIHLGFLKLLKGSSLREKAEEFGCVFTDKAPYEVLQTDAISYQELQRLHVIEDLVDKYYNSHRFNDSLAYITEKYGNSGFKFFDQFAQHWVDEGCHLVSHTQEKLYKLFYDLMGEKDVKLRDLLKLDYRKNERKRPTPEWMGTRDDFKLENQIIRSGKIFEVLPELKSLSPREIGKQIKIEYFDSLDRWILFHYPVDSDLGISYFLTQDLLTECDSE